MTQEHDEGQQPFAEEAMDDIPPMVIDDDAPTPSFSARAKRPTGGSPWPMLIAVVLGGGLAVGIVKMIPDRWLPQRKPATVRDAQSPEDGDLPEFQPDGQPFGSRDSDELADKSTPERQPRRTVEQTADDPAAKLAKRREEEAASLLRRANALIKIRYNDDAVKLLEKILNRYDDTRTAVEAEKTLQTINRR